MLRDSVLDAASEITAAKGWDAVTMQRIAERVGVSRQTVYKEVGSKPALAEAVLARETDRFLDGIDARLREHGSDLAAGFAAAAEYTLRTAADNALLKAVLSGAHGGADELLPLLTTKVEPVLERAIGAITGYVERHSDGQPVGREQLEIIVDTVVRLTLSHMTQPTMPVDRAAEQIRWVAGRLFAGPVTP